MSPAVVPPVGDILRIATPFVGLGTIVLWAVLTIVLEYHWVRYAASSRGRAAARIAHYGISGALVAALLGSLLF